MDADNPFDIIEAASRERPDAVRLAEAVSPAALVEPELLRKARLELLKGVDAGAEADLWFGPLVQSHSTATLELLPAVVDALRQRLSADPPRLAASARLIRDFHGYAAPAIRIEEELTLLALSDEPDALPRIRKLLLSVLAGVVQGVRPGFARWAVRALRRMPEAVRQTEEAAMLAVSAGARLGGRQILDRLPDGVFGKLRFLLPRDLKTVPVGVRLLEAEPEGPDGPGRDPEPAFAVEFSEPPAEAARAHTIRLPQTSPMLLQLSWDEGAGERRQKQVSLLYGQTQTVDVPSPEVTILTPLGDLHTLARAARRPERVRPVEIFFSYSHRDEELRRELAMHLTMLRNEGIIGGWHDRKIAPGRDWDGVIDEQLNDADIILLLVSPDFLASDYCYDIEVTRAMERHEAGEAYVIPVILRPCNWQSTPFAKLQALPSNAVPITRWPDRDEAFLNVAEGVRHAAGSLLSRRKSQHETVGGGVAPPRPTVIPRPPAFGFVSRRDAQGRDIIERLRVELAPGRNRLVTLSGPGGIGKTTLAAEVARSLLGTYDRRVTWSSAEGRPDFTLSALLDDIATQLGRADLRTLTPEAKVEQVRVLVADPPALVVLDSYEVIGAEEQRRIESWFSRTQCSALFTSRPRVAGTVFVPVSAMSREEAEEFLERLAGQTMDPQVFTPDVRRRVYETAEANPYVMQWVMGQIDEAREPETVFEELGKGQGDAAERVFARSFNLPQLGDDGRDALLALSLFSPDASRPALAEVAGFGDDMNRLGEAVRRLANFRFVEATSLNRRLLVRGLTRTLATSRLAADERAGDFRRRYILYFLNYAGERRQQTPENLDALESERDNLLDAAEEAFKLEGWQVVMTLGAVLNDFLMLRGYWDEALTTAELAEEAARQAGDEFNVASFMSATARIRMSRGEYGEAAEIYREVLTIFRQLRNERSAAAVLHQLGSIAQAEGRLEEATRLYKESLGTEERLGDRLRIASTLHQMANIGLRRGDLEQARDLYNESLEIEKRLDNQSGIAASLHQLGRLAQEQDELEEAARLYRESLEIKRRLGDQLGTANSLHQLGLLAVRRGDHEEAARLLREALAIFEKLGSPAAEVARGNLARLER